MSDMAAVVSGSSASAVAAGSVRRSVAARPGFSVSLPTMPVSAWPLAVVSWGAPARGRPLVSWVARGRCAPGRPDIPTSGPGAPAGRGWVGVGLAGVAARPWVLSVTAEHAGIGTAVIAVHGCLLHRCLPVVRCASTGDVHVGSVVWLRRSGQRWVVVAVASLELLLAGFGWSRLRYRDLVGPGGWFGLEAASVAVVEVAADDMEDSGDRDGEQRPEERTARPMRMLTSTVSADSLNGARHDDRLQDVVLQLLVHHEHHQDHDGGGQGVQGGHGDGHHGAQGRPDQGDQVGEANEQGDDSAVGHAHDPQHDVGDDGDDADHQVAGHVASDRLGAVSGHPPDPFLTALGGNALTQAERS